MTQQQESAGEVPEWSVERFCELAGIPYSDDNFSHPHLSEMLCKAIKAGARYIATHEPKGEVPKLLTPEQAARIAELRDPELVLGALALAGLIAPEPEPVDALRQGIKAVILSKLLLPKPEVDELVDALCDFARTAPSPAKGEGLLVAEFPPEPEQDGLRLIAVMIRDYFLPEGDEEDVQWVLKLLREHNVTAPSPAKGV